METIKKSIIEKDIDTNEKPLVLDSTDIYNLLEALRAGGELDLYAATPEQCQKLQSWFEKTFEQLSFKEQFEILQQFILYQFFNDERVVFYLKKMSGDERRVIGNFIFSMADIKRYYRSFQACWLDLSAEEQKKYSEFLVANNDLAFVVAPFIEFKNEIKFDDDQAKRYFMESLLDYRQANPSEKLDPVEKNLSLLDKKILADYRLELKDLGLK